MSSYSPQMYLSPLQCKSLLTLPTALGMSDWADRKFGIKLSSNSDTPLNVDTLKYQYVPKAKTLWWRWERNVFPTRLQKFQLVNVQALALTIKSCSRKYFIRHENNCVTFIIIVQLGWWWKHSSIKITASQGILGKNLSGMRVVFIFWNIIL